jgi:hypothetical protein
LAADHHQRRFNLYYFPLSKQTTPIYISSRMHRYLAILQSQACACRKGAKPIWIAAQLSLACVPETGSRGAQQQRYMCTHGLTVSGARSWPSFLACGLLSQGQRARHDAILCRCQQLDRLVAADYYTYRHPLLPTWLNYFVLQLDRTESTWDVGGWE